MAAKHTHTTVEANRSSFCALQLLLQLGNVRLQLVHALVGAGQLVLQVADLLRLFGVRLAQLNENC